MTGTAGDTAGEAVRFREPGASWAALLFGPLFGLLGVGVEFFTGGQVQVVMWAVVAGVLVAFTALWVYARRTYCAVELTPAALIAGPETLPVESITEVVDGDAPHGARVLGGGMGVPRKYYEIPLRLEDGSVVVAWARDGDGLRSALEDVMQR